VAEGPVFVGTGSVVYEYSDSGQLEGTISAGSSEGMAIGGSTLVLGEGTSARAPDTVVGYNDSTGPRRRWRGVHGTS
jgi:hypothetical protein